MRQIKFRAENRNGKIIYCEPFSSSPNSLFDFAKFCEAVDFDTVAQLLGRDEYGQEIYEGDVIDYTAESPLGFPVGLPLSAQLAVVLVDKFGKHYFAPKKFRWLVGSDKEYFP